MRPLHLLPQDELESIIADLQSTLKAKHADVSAFYPHAYPVDEVPVLVHGEGLFGIQTLRWGYSVS